MTDPRLLRPLWRGRTNVDALTIAVVEAAELSAGHRFTVTKGSYQPDSDALSGSTHTGGGVVDLDDCGHPDCLRHLRAAGGFAWRRGPQQGFRPHFHVGVIGHPRLSPAAARQELQYLRNTGNGLVGSTHDDGPRLTPIPRPVWPPQPTGDDTMTEDQLERLAQLVAARLLETSVTVSSGSGRPRTLSLRQLLRELHQRLRKLDA